MGRDPDQAGDPHRGLSTPPALVNLNVPWADEYARDDLLTPIDGLLGAARGNYLPGTLQDLTFKGKTYGFPDVQQCGRDRLQPRHLPRRRTDAQPRELRRAARLCAPDRRKNRQGKATCASKHCPRSTACSCGRA
ncbi:hypothetical protein LP419_08450 [Massilia sp. H-1]|nr:hypothetical protein LP419_08450 [Massilia sp. H-1]